MGFLTLYQVCSPNEVEISARGATELEQDISGSDTKNH